MNEKGLSMYKINYPQIANMGDLLNKDMLEELFHVEIKNVQLLRCNMIGIGSGLGQMLFSDNKVRALKQRLYFPFTNELHVWGTGFIRHNQHEDNPFAYKKVVIHSLRGNLTKKRVEKILGKELDVPLGDGGLLAEKWLGYYPDKQYRVGIIPHFKEKDSPFIPELKSFYNDCTVIDLSDKPKDVVKKIAECETVISSSLHGLIVADSFHIPNVHMNLFDANERIIGDGYKFEDYYSSFGLSDNVITIKEHKWPSAKDIEDSYRLTYDAVELKKKQIYEVFPKL